jgi:hypothetical protein
MGSCLVFASSESQPERFATRWVDDHNPAVPSPAAAARQAIACGEASPRLHSPALSGHHEIDPTATALRAHQSLAPIRHRCLGAVALGHFRCVGLDLVATIPAPHDQPHMRRCGIAERHWRTAVRLQRRFRHRPFDGGS